MKAMPLPAGSPATSFLQASRPPAEAPIPTIGNPLGLREGEGSGGAREVDRALAALGGCGRLLGIGAISKWFASHCEAMPEIIRTFAPRRRSIEALSRFRTYLGRSSVRYCPASVHSAGACGIQGSEDSPPRAFLSWT